MILPDKITSAEENGRWVEVAWKLLLKKDITLEEVQYLGKLADLITEFEDGNNPVCSDLV